MALPRLAVPLKYHLGCAPGSRLAPWCLQAVRRLVGAEPGPAATAESKQLSYGEAEPLPHIGRQSRRR